MTKIRIRRVLKRTCFDLCCWNKEDVYGIWAIWTIVMLYKNTIAYTYIEIKTSGEL